MAKMYYQAWRGMIHSQIKELEEKDPRHRESYNKFTNVTMVQDLNLWNREEFIHYVSNYISLMSKPGINTSGNLLSLMINQRLDLGLKDLISLCNTIKSLLPKNVVFKTTTESLILQKVKS